MSLLSDWFTRNFNSAVPAAPVPSIEVAASPATPAALPELPAALTGPLARLRDAVDAISYDGMPDADIDTWTSAFAGPMLANDITTPRRISALLGRVSVETGGLKSLSENLNYNAASLVRVWPSHFNAAIADSYAHQPEKIANRAYANRMGNGNETSGDGWRFRGSGGLQETGREGHTAFAKAMKMTPEQAADFMRTIPGAAAQACWYWTSRNCNASADIWALSQITMKINGGTNGLQESIVASNEVMAIFN